MLDKAISITANAFEGKYDRGGKPYILHCLHVMNQMPDDDDYKCAAVMHDLIEDTWWSLDDLRAIGFNEKVVIAVMYLTHDEDVEYDEYIRRISTCKISTAVKLADLKHNSDITRIKGLIKKDFDRLEKYHRAYAYLRD